MFEFLGWELGCGYPSNSPEKWLSSLRRLIYWLSGLLFSPHPPKTNKQFIDTLVFLQKHYLSLLHLLLWQKSVTVNPVCVMNFVMNKPVEQFFSFLAVHANVPSSCCVLDKEQVITGSWAFAMAPPMFVSVWREGCFLSVSCWFTGHHVLSFSWEIPELKWLYLPVYFFITASLTSKLRSNVDLTYSINCCIPRVQNSGTWWVFNIFWTNEQNIVQHLYFFCFLKAAVCICCIGWNMYSV